MTSKKTIQSKQMTRLMGNERLHLSSLLTEPQGPRTARYLSLWLSLLVFSFVYWMMVTKVEELTQAPGEIVPTGFTQVIQHYEGGILEKVHVEEGSAVKEGTVLITLSELGLQEEINSIKSSIKRLKKDKELNQEEMVMKKNLLDNGLLPKVELLELKRAIHQVDNNLEQQQEKLTTLENKASRLTLRSPSIGIVKDLKVNTVGEVVESGETLMEIVPTNQTLVVEARVSPQDIGHIKVGQKVRVKVSSYDYGRYGTIDGKITLLTASTLQDNQGQSYYRARIKLLSDHVGEHETLKILPGMTVEAGVITGEKTVFAYLLKPIQHALQNSLSER